VNASKPEPLRPASIPEKATVDGLEAKWVPSWEQNQTFAFNADAPKENVFSVDTPPPTASGSLHVGHVFSYTGQRCLLSDGLG
jgi:valyl-tRNA synthetase